MNPGQRIQLYVDDSRVGSGYRRFLVLEVGRKWVTTLYLPTLTKIKFPIQEIEHNRSYSEIEGNRRILRRLIKDAVRERKRLGLPYSESGTKAALELLS